MSRDPTIIPTPTVEPPRKASDASSFSDEYKTDSTATSSLNGEKAPPLAAKAQVAGGFGLWVVGLFSAKQRRKNKVDLDAVGQSASRA